MSERVIKRPGVRFVRELRADEEWIALTDGRLLIVHPDRGLVVIDHDGLEWTPDLSEEGQELASSLEVFRPAN